MSESEAPKAAEELKGPNGLVGPHHNHETGEIHHWGPHSTQVIHAGGAIVKLRHGESIIPSSDGSPSIVFRRRED